MVLFDLNVTTLWISLVGALAKQSTAAYTPRTHLRSPETLPLKQWESPATAKITVCRQIHRDVGPKGILYAFFLKNKKILWKLYTLSFLCPSCVT